MGGKALMSVAEGNVSLATDLPKYQLLFNIKGKGAVACMILPTLLTLPFPTRDETRSVHSVWFPA